jgi:hypothetical protein
MLVTVKKLKMLQMVAGVVKRLRKNQNKRLMLPNGVTMGQKTLKINKFNLNQRQDGVMEMRKKMMLLGAMIKKIKLLGGLMTLNLQMTNQNQEGEIDQIGDALTAFKRDTTQETVLSRKNQDRAIIASKKATWRENVQSLGSHERHEKATMTEKIKESIGEKPEIEMVHPE